MMKMHRCGCIATTGGSRQMHHMHRHETAGWMMRMRQATMVMLVVMVMVSVDVQRHCEHGGMFDAGILRWAVGGVVIDGRSGRSFVLNGCLNLRN